MDRTRADVTAWLLDSDPALRWQVERDVAGEPPGVWRATPMVGSVVGCDRVV